MNRLLFAEPLWLWAAAGGVSLLAGFIAFSAKKRRAQLAVFASAELLPELMASHSPARRVVKNSLLLLAVLLVGIALARPQWGVVTEEVKRKGEDVVFVLDISKSMLARDVTPNRLERAKNAVRDFVTQHATGRVGLVAFGGDAFLWCPLTLDYEGFEETLADLSPDHLNIPGSDIAAALYAARSAFEKTDKRKVLVVLSDGEDLQKLGIKAAEKMAEEGVLIFTIGVGSAAGTQILVPGPNAVPEPLLDDSGQPVISALDEPTLTAIAAATGGSYRLLTTVAGGMADVAKALRDTEKRGAAQIRTRGIDRYQWPLGVAILLLVVESLLATRRRARALSKS